MTGNNFPMVSDAVVFKESGIKQELKFRGIRVFGRFFGMVSAERTDIGRFVVVDKYKMTTRGGG